VGDIAPVLAEHKVLRLRRVNRFALGSAALRMTIFFVVADLS